MSEADGAHVHRRTLFTRADWDDAVADGTLSTDDVARLHRIAVHEFGEKGAAGYDEEGSQNRGDDRIRHIVMAWPVAGPEDVAVPRSFPKKFRDDVITVARDRSAGVTCSRSRPIPALSPADAEMLECRPGIGQVRHAVGACG